MTGDERVYRSVVFLVAYGPDDDVIDEAEMSYEDYYDGSPPIIDESKYRAARGIRRVTGKVYNSSGKLQQEFDNHYNERGEYQRSRVVHEDGTVIED